MKQILVLAPRDVHRLAGLLTSFSVTPIADRTAVVHDEHIGL